MCGSSEEFSSKQSHSSFKPHSTSRQLRKFSGFFVPLYVDFSLSNFHPLCESLIVKLMDNFQSCSLLSLAVS